jgi:arylsulfatase A-like enzyme
VCTFGRLFEPLESRRVALGLPEISRLHSTASHSLSSDTDETAGLAVVAPRLAGVQRVAVRRCRKWRRDLECRPGVQGYRILLMLALCGLVGCGAPQKRAAAPHVLFVLIDTLRSDHLGCYGYQRDTTPTIDRLAETGLLFETTVAQASWTLPSLASMFASQYPPQHYTARSSIAASEVLLAEVLRNAGYHTVSVATNPYVQHVSQLTQGFEEEELSVSAPADWVVDRAIEKVDLHVSRSDADPAAPLFLYLHFMDVHFPHKPPPPFDTMFQTFEGAPRDSRQSGKLRWLDAEGLDSKEFQTYRSQVVALYDGSLRYVDSQLARLLAHVADTPLAENLVTVIVSDHGEELWDHARRGKELGLRGLRKRKVYGVLHGHTLFPELVEVPWILHGAGIPRGRISQQVRLIDVAPTLLALAGIEPSSLSMEGTDVLSVAGQGTLEDALALSRIETPSAVQISIRDGQYQFLRIDDRELLFETGDIALEDVGDRKPAERNRLRQALEAELSGASLLEVGEVVVPESVEAALRALGYVN